MTEADAMVEKIKKLSAPDQLRLAAELLENQRPQLALAIALRICGELDLAVGLTERGRR